MARNPSESPLRVRLSDERRARMLASIKGYYADQLDEDLSDFRAGELLDFFVAELGPTVYNQGVQDACASVRDKLEDIAAEVYEPERPYAR